MTRNAALPPFLQKLKMISETVPAQIADWADDGASYVVKDSDKFEEVLKQHFKGSLQTFIRQLHFYGFRKLDAHSGGWSFAHKNFRRGRPELVAEIRRKTRSDAAANGAATQVEVQQLRSQVAKLQGVVEDLRTQLDSVLTVLDTAGVVDVVKQPDGKTQAVRLPAQDGSGRKRSRLACGGGLGDEDLLDVSDGTEGCELSEAGAQADVSDFLLPGAPGADEDDVGMELEPLPVEMVMDELFNLEESSELFDGLSEADLTAPSEEMVEEPEAGAVAEGAAAGVPGMEAATTAKVVADGTELDADSVTKVLGFLKKVIKSEAKSPSSQKAAALVEQLSFSRIQDAILNYRDVTLPTQEVGAN